MEIFAYIALLVVSALITYSMMPEPESKKPESLSDIDFPQFEEGTPQAVVFGDVWINNWMVTAYGNYRTEEIRGSGGK